MTISHYLFVSHLMVKVRNSSVMREHLIAIFDALKALHLRSRNSQNLGGTYSVRRLLTVYRTERLEA